MHSHFSKRCLSEQVCFAKLLGWGMCARGKAGLQEGVSLELVLRVLQELEYGSSTESMEGMVKD